MTKPKKTVSLKPKRVDRAKKNLIPARKAKSTVKVREKFDIKVLPASIKKSPLKLRDWLNHHIPWLIGPRIDAIDPPGGQRGTILTLSGARFATARTDNQVTVGGTPVPVLAASASELKVLVTKDVDTGPVKVKIGSRTGIGPYDFAVKGYPGGGDDGPPVFAMGAGAGEAGDVNPIGTVRVLVVVCQAADKIPANLANVRTGLNDRWSNVHTFYTQASYTRTDVQFDIVNTAAALDGNFSDFVDLSASVQNVIGGQKM
ncbi:MAG TPA: hypothetical protein DCE18_11985, partial [Syntrophobacteraceae bacterium]|nr:hypothetical protein [Syntrophobacteraceae bacterium]